MCNIMDDMLNYLFKKGSLWTWPCSKKDRYGHRPIIERHAKCRCLHQIGP